MPYIVRWKCWTHLLHRNALPSQTPTRGGCRRTAFPCKSPRLHVVSDAPIGRAIKCAMEGNTPGSRTRNTTQSRQSHGQVSSKPQPRPPHHSQLAGTGPTRADFLVDLVLHPNHRSGAACHPASTNSPSHQTSIIVALPADTRHLRDPHGTRLQHPLYCCEAKRSESRSDCLLKWPE